MVSVKAAAVIHDCSQGLFFLKEDDISPDVFPGGNKGKNGRVLPSPQDSAASDLNTNSMCGPAIFQPRSGLHLLVALSPLAMTGQHCSHTAKHTR